MRRPVTERYYNDVTFRQLVDMLLSYIDRAEFTPSEIREAAMFAQILYEETRLRPRFVEVIHGESMLKNGDPNWIK